MNDLNKIIRLSQGNAGAIKVLGELAIMDYTYLLELEKMEILGSDIWLCYKDVCKQNIFSLMTAIEEKTILQSLNDLPEKRGFNKEETELLNERD